MGAINQSMTEQEKAIKAWKLAYDAQLKAGEEIMAIFRPLVEAKLKDKDYQGAREICRPIPVDCVTKVLLFRQIIVWENESETVDNQA